MRGDWDLLFGNPIYCVNLKSCKLDFYKEDKERRKAFPKINWDCNHWTDMIDLHPSTISEPRTRVADPV